ncbi:MAG: S9 family peptidase [Fluviicola sp. XM-24bin1]|nr:MAG: S9 family peptidase [Fluviicola sp. XM-24bin1]
MKIHALFSALFISAAALAQQNIDYQKPPQEILDLVDVELAPSSFFNSKKDLLVAVQSDQFATIEAMSREELRLGGLRIDPVRNIGSRVRYYRTISIQDLSKKTGLVQVKGTPENAQLTNFSWSPNEKYMACTNTTSEGVELWLIDVYNASMKKIYGPTLNANTGDVINWLEDSENIIIKVTSKDRKELIDTKSAIPTGPTISTSDGKKAQNRTYQDLLKNKNDEHNFEQLVLTELVKVDLNGNSSSWLPSDMYRSITFSPDGEYAMVTTIQKPFSYLVPYGRFPSKTVIYTKDGKEVSTVLEVPLIEDLPKGFMATRTGRRSMRWRSDRAATLVFAQALDGGDPENEVEYRDEVFQLEAPFNGEPTSLMKTINRFSGIMWGNHGMAMASDYWWNTRNTKTYLFDPSNPSKKPEIIQDRNYQDRYSDPGSPVMVKNEWGSYVLDIDKESIFMIGDGYTEKGQFPFLSKYNTKTKKTTRIYTSTYTDKVENLYEYDRAKNQLLVRIESPTEYPNYYSRSLKSKKLKQITDFQNPFKALDGMHKELIKYKREDGLDLSGTLYLPPGYDMESKEKLPLIIWAYPREYKDKSSAGQSTSNPNKFTYLWYGSPVYWVTQGYAVLDGAAFPIVGEGDEEPNDSFRTQLVANAKAAIDAVDELGYIDRNRVACGGHSYGAFMVANLLSHSDLFAAGIARSGAYNRTLTLFGFQSEERSYWDAPDVYYTMSPFMHADKMKHPLLLIHGEADNNSGTYPMQSERYFNALKGLGATVRLVMLPKESHGYRAKESVLHVLWEQHEWLEKYVKNKGE